MISYVCGLSVYEKSHSSGCKERKEFIMHSLNELAVGMLNETRETESKCDRYKGHSSIYFKFAVGRWSRYSDRLDYSLQGRTIVRFLPAVPQ